MSSSRLVRIALVVLASLALTGADIRVLRLQAKLGTSGGSSPPTIAAPPVTPSTGCTMPATMPCVLGG